MIFERQQLYSAHIDPTAVNPYESVELISEGFSFFAFIFSFLWFAYHKLWVAALIALTIAVAIPFAVETLHLAPAVTTVLNLGLRFGIGLLAYDIHRATLERRGWLTTDILVAEGQVDATRRFHERYASMAA